MGFLVQPITIQSLIGKNRKIGEISVNVVINETTNDTLTITKQPVQQGASITDHAYKEPTAFSMNAFFQDNSISGLVSALNPFGAGVSGGLSKIYKQLQDLQSSRVPFDIITPKRIYRSMLMSVLGNTTDKQTENVLAISMSFQEVLIVNVVTTQVPRVRQKFAAVTGATQNAGKKSALLTLKEGIGGLIAR